MSDTLPCLDLLGATPAILRGLTSEISEEDARWKPAEDRFSIAGGPLLSEELPEFEPDDAQMHLEVYKNADPEEDLLGHIRQVAELVRSARITR